MEMLDRVLAACAEADAIGRTLLVTPDSSLARDGVEVLVDAGTGHADAIALALADPGRGRRLVVMADCPLVTPESLDALARRRPGRSRSPRPGRRRQRARARGSERLRAALRRPGGDDRGRGARRGLEPVVVDDPALALDVDRPEDYELLLAVGDERRRHLLAEGLHPADEALPGRLPLLHVRAAAAPRRAAYMTADEVLAVAREGAEAGCHEALFTLGDKPELRYRAAREELAALGCETTIEYLARMAELVLSEAGLLPHLNPGVMTRRTSSCCGRCRRRWG